MFTLSAKSGKGDAQLTGKIRLDPVQGWPSELTLTSHNLEVSNFAEAYVLVDSNVKLSIQGNAIDIDGDITIPLANLKPRTLPEGAVPVSPDVVIIRTDKDTAGTAGWLLSTRLRVQLGDQVDFDGFRTRGKLRGKFVYVDETGKLPTGEGEISIVDGIYRMSGQELTIRRGRLIFTNTFIDDPGLDVEAVRKVENVTAGIRLKGTLKQPQLSVFSEPVMPETEALSYLVLGHGSSQSTAAESQSVNNTAMAFGFVAGDYLEKGIGGRLGLDELRVDVNRITQNTSLIVGKYLSPKLILRYYSGIADSSRLVQLEYQLSKRVQIQTESGYNGSQQTTGGDIFFVIEY
jgi:translocation and assembly module TamB